MVNLLQKKLLKEKAVGIIETAYAHKKSKTSSERNAYFKDFRSKMISFKNITANLRAKTLYYSIMEEKDVFQQFAEHMNEEIA